MVDYNWRQCADTQCSIDTQKRRSEVGGSSVRLQPPDPTSLSTDARTFWWARLGMHDSLGGQDTASPPPDPNCSTCGQTIVPGSTQILGVRGASFTTRVFWREGLDWRHLTQTAILTNETR